MPVLSGLFLSTLFAGYPTLSTYRSGAAQTHLLELFTSEGCSSCPPAEAYFLKLRDDPNVWKRFIPVQFHVDYWDRLGWPDTLATPKFTQRQQQYVQLWGDSSVYTPCFVRDGLPTHAPWAQAAGEGRDVGTLTVSQLSANTFRVVFAPSAPAHGQARIVGIAVADHIWQHVRAGENRGRVLDHAFVAVTAREAALHAEHGVYTGTITLERRTDVGALHVAFWVTTDHLMQPVQAVGGPWL